MCTVEYPTLYCAFFHVFKEIDVNKVKVEELDFKSNFQLEAIKDGTLDVRELLRNTVLCLLNVLLFTSNNFH